MAPIGNIALVVCCGTSDGLTKTHPQEAGGPAHYMVGAVGRGCRVATGRNVMSTIPERVGGRYVADGKKPSYARRKVSMKIIHFQRSAYMVRCSLS